MALMLLTRIQNHFASLRDKEDGVTMVEYGLLAALIAVALIVAIGTLEGGLSHIFSEIGNKLSAL